MAPVDVAAAARAVGKTRKAKGKDSIHYLKWVEGSKDWARICATLQTTEPAVVERILKITLQYAAPDFLKALDVAFAAWQKAGSPDDKKRNL
jgi:hypothetical protein